MWNINESEWLFRNHVYNIVIFSDERVIKIFSIFRNFAPATRSFVSLNCVWPKNLPLRWRFQSFRVKPTTLRLKICSSNWKRSGERNNIIIHLSKQGFRCQNLGSNIVHLLNSNLSTYKIYSFISDGLWHLRTLKSTSWVKSFSRRLFKARLTEMEKKRRLKVNKKRTSGKHTKHCKQSRWTVLEIPVFSLACGACHAPMLECTDFISSPFTLSFRFIPIRKHRFSSKRGNLDPNNCKTDNLGLNWVKIKFFSCIVFVKI